MPAAAVIPAPIAYINVVVFKKLVVGTRLPRSSRLRRKLVHLEENARQMTLNGRLTLVQIYFEKIRVLKASTRRCIKMHGIIEQEVHICCVGLKYILMINRDRRGYMYSNARGEILGPFEDNQKRKHIPSMFSLIKNES